MQIKDSTNNELDADQINEALIACITKKLEDFCFGEYKNEKDYPVAMSRIAINAPNGKTGFNIRCKLYKNTNGILRRVMIGINLDSVQA